MEIQKQDLCPILCFGGNPPLPGISVLGRASWGLCSSRRFLVWQPWPVLVQPVSCHVPLPRGRGCALPPRAPSGRAGCRAAERVGTRTGVEHPHPEDLASLPPFLPQGGPALLPQHPQACALLLVLGCGSVSPEQGVGVSQRPSRTGPATQNCFPVKSPCSPSCSTGA